MKSNPVHFGPQRCVIYRKGSQKIIFHIFQVLAVCDVWSVEKQHLRVTRERYPFKGVLFDCRNRETRNFSESTWLYRYYRIIKRNSLCFVF